MDSSRPRRPASNRPAQRPPATRPKRRPAQAPLAKDASIAATVEPKPAPPKPRRVRNTNHRTSRENRKPQSNQSSPPPIPKTAPGWLAVSRGAALFLGLFTLLNLIGEAKHPGFDANLWWIDLRPLSHQQAQGLLALTGAVLMLYALKPNLPTLIQLVTRFVVLTCAAFAAMNAYNFYLLLNQDKIISHFPVAFSLHVLALLTVIFAGLWNNQYTSQYKTRDFFLGLMTFVLCLVGFPLSQMYCYGNTDYRRPADAILTFGCRAFADGSPSVPLRDRTLTACQLYQAGLAPVLIFSGGPGEGEIHETTVMKQIALEAGVPESAIRIDEQGWNTRDTIENTRQMFLNQPEPASVLAVSSFYHLPRIKMTAERAGLTFYTVPAEQSEQTQHESVNLGRELLALWWYYTEPLLPTIKTEQPQQGASTNGTPLSAP